MSENTRCWGLAELNWVVKSVESAERKVQHNRFSVQCCLGVRTNVMDLAVVQNHTTNALSLWKSQYPWGWKPGCLWRGILRPSPAECRRVHMLMSAHLSRPIVGKVSENIGLNMMCFQSTNSRQLQSQHVTRCINKSVMRRRRGAVIDLFEQHDGLTPCCSQALTPWVAESQI